MKTRIVNVDKIISKHTVCSLRNLRGFGSLNFKKIHTHYVEENKY